MYVLLLGTSSVWVPRCWRRCWLLHRAASSKVEGCAAGDDTADRLITSHFFRAAKGRRRDAETRCVVAPGRMYAFSRSL
jgi:hypothetical protein